MGLAIGGDLGGTGGSGSDLDADPNLSEEIEAPPESGVGGSGATDKSGELGSDADMGGTGGSGHSGHIEGSTETGAEGMGGSGATDESGELGDDNLGTGTETQQQ